jgi:hypothetical protein
MIIIDIFTVMTAVGRNQMFAYGQVIPDRQRTIQLRVAAGRLALSGSSHYPFFIRAGFTAPKSLLFSLLTFLVLLVALSLIIHRHGGK